MKTKTFTFNCWTLADGIDVIDSMDIDITYEEALLVCNALDILGIGNGYAFTQDNEGEFDSYICPCEQLYVESDYSKKDEE